MPRPRGKGGPLSWVLAELDTIWPSRLVGLQGAGHPEFILRWSGMLWKPGSRLKCK